MTVKEFIEKLKWYDQDLEVYIIYRTNTFSEVFMATGGDYEEDDPPNKNVKDKYLFLFGEIKYYSDKQGEEKDV